MTDYFDLDELADEKAVRREYARLIREIRPEDDPLRFSDLHEQYKHALMVARYRDMHPDEDDADEDDSDETWHHDDVAEENAESPFSSLTDAIEHDGDQEDEDEYEPYPLPTAEEIEEYETFASRLRDALSKGDPFVLRTFLHTDDALFSLEDKHRFSQHAFETIVSDQEMIPSEEQMHEIEDFFGWTESSYIHDILALRRTVRANQVIHKGKVHKRVMETLSEPNSAWNNLRLVLGHSRRFAISNWIQRVRMDFHDVPDPALSERVDFVEEVGMMRNRNPWNLLGLALPVLGILVLFFGPIFLLGEMEDASGKPPSWMMALVGLSYLGVIYLIYVSFQQFSNWLGPVGSYSFRIWAWRIFIALLAIFAVFAAIAGHPIAIIWLLIFGGRWLFNRGK